MALIHCEERKLLSSTGELKIFEQFSYC